MVKIMAFIDYRNLISSQYIVDIFQIPGVIIDHLFDIMGTQIDLVRTYVFMGGYIESQTTFIETMLHNGFEVEINPQFQSKDRQALEKGTDVALACRMLSLASNNAYDIAVLISGDADIFPAVKEIRELGKRVLICSFEDRIANIYKNPQHGINSMDFEVFNLDDVLNIIAVQAMDDVSPQSVIKEIKNDFLDANIDYDKIRIKRYITYWGTRARYLQTLMAENRSNYDKEELEIPRNTFETLNQLSNEYRPGYIKVMNRNWTPDSWEEELKRIPKVW